MADQILPGGGTAFANLFLEKRPYFAVRLAQDLLIGDSNFEEIMNPFSKQIARLCGDTEYVSGDPRRNLLCVVGRGVTVFLIGKPSDQLAADRPSLRFVTPDRFSGKKRQEDILLRLMYRWIGRERWRGRHGWPSVSKHWPAR